MFPVFLVFLLFFILGQIELSVQFRWKPIRKPQTLCSLIFVSVQLSSDQNVHLNYILSFDYDISIYLLAQFRTFQGSLWTLIFRQKENTKTIYKYWKKMTWRLSPLIITFYKCFKTLAEIFLFAYLKRQWITVKCILSVSLFIEMEIWNKNRNNKKCEITSTRFQASLQIIRMIYTLFLSSMADLSYTVTYA